MPRDEKLIKKRNKRIMELYKKYSDEKTQSGKSKYRFEYIMEMIGKEVFLTQSSITQIINKELKK